MRATVLCRCGGRGASVALAGLALAAMLSAACARLDPATDSSRPRHSPEPRASNDPGAGTPFVFPAPGSTFVTLRPTTTADRFDPADIKPPGTGRLSLREAFALANELDVEAAIVLRRGAVYRLERCGALEGTADEENELVHTVDKTLTINGNAATIFQDCDGAGIIEQRGGHQLLNIVDVTLRGGRARRSQGGAVWSSGTGEVRITNSVLLDNQVAGAGLMSAGAVASSGDVVVSGATIARNTSEAGVGGVAAVGSVKLIKSSLYGNVGPVAGALQGGKNVAPGAPAGAPSFTGNTPDGVTLVYSTLVGNSTPAVRVGWGELTSFASVISGDGSGALCDLNRAHGHSLGANFLHGGEGCDLAAASDQRGTAADPKLATVRGMKLMEVYAPQAVSPLRDAIARDDCMPPAVRALLPVYSGGTSDQLGVPRPQGKGCDIGAIEAVETGALARSIASVPMSDLAMPVRWLPEPIELAADEIRVTTTEDTLGAAGGVSLRDAFGIANRAVRATTIILRPRATYRLTRCEAPQAAVDNETDDLVYLSAAPLHLQGNGATIVQTCDGSGVMALFSDAAVTLRDVTLTGGRSVIHPGGGIYLASAGRLRLERAWITDNSTVAAGGGIAAFGEVELLDSTVSNNHSTEVGGGIIGTADVTAINSSLFDNLADLAIGAIGNHSGRLTLLFTTIHHNSAPNVAVGSISAFGSVISNYLPPHFPPGPPPGLAPPGPPPGAAPPRSPPEPAAAGMHDGPPPGAPGAAGFPPPANCAVEHPGRILEGNFATDASCGFASVGRDPRLLPAGTGTHLSPAGGSPLIALVPAAACIPFRGTLDQLGHARPVTGACTSGAVAAAR